MIIDCHVHARGNESAAEIVRGMDVAGVDKIVLFAPPPASKWHESEFTMRQASEWLAGVVRQAPERIIPFAWIDAALPGAADEVEHAIVDLGFRGLKMMPNHWYPSDEMAFPVYAKAQALGAPILFHSGILFGQADCSRFCQPVYYEALIHFPGLQFALAHISWPWVDECLAVAGRFRSHAQRSGAPMQMWIDTTPGTPPLWRPEALQKTLAYLGDERILWGSDATGGTMPRAGQTLANDRAILHSVLGGNVETERRWLGENAVRFLGL